MTVAQKISVRAKAIVAAAFTVVLLALSSPAAHAQTPATVPQQGVSQVQDEVRNTLSQYGRFVQHHKY